MLGHRRQDALRHIPFSCLPLNVYFFWKLCCSLGPVLRAIAKSPGIQGDPYFLVLGTYQFSSVTQSCLTLCDPWTAASQASLSFTNSWTLLKFMSIKLMMPSNHLILCRALLPQLQSYPASGSFSMSRLFASGGQSIGASAPNNKLKIWIKLF